MTTDATRPRQDATVIKITWASANANNAPKGGIILLTFGRYDLPSALPVTYTLGTPVTVTTKIVDSLAVFYVNTGVIGGTTAEVEIMKYTTYNVDINYIDPTV